MSVLPLNMLRVGERALVDQVVGARETVARLEELGFRSGKAVEVVQKGSPCIVRLAGAKLCFRHSEEINVLVRPEHGS